MLFGEHTNKYDREFFVRQIGRRMEELENDGEGYPLDFRLYELNVLKANVYGLCDIWGLFSPDYVLEMAKPVREAIRRAEEAMEAEGGDGD